MVRIVAISDTHNKHDALELPDGDILIHAGDFTGHGKFDEVEAFANWFEAQPHQHKICIAGNHELSLDPAQRAYGEHIVRLLWNREFKYLHNSSTQCAGFKIYGTPWTPYFHGWAFNGSRTEPHPDDGNGGPSLVEIYNQISDDTQILICHGPPLNCLDRIVEGSHKGSAELRDRITQLPFLQLVVCGHIHEGRGVEHISGVQIVNASTLDRSYRQIRPPMVIDL